MQNKLHDLNLYVDFFISRQQLLPFVTFKLKVTAPFVVWYAQHVLCNNFLEEIILLLLVKVTIDLIFWREILRNIFFLQPASYNHGLIYHISTV